MLSWVSFGGVPKKYAAMGKRITVAIRKETIVFMLLFDFIVESLLNVKVSQFEIGQKSLDWLPDTTPTT
jgi:hypothetical protein